ncbi:hypothetical protein Agabi119p4_5624 [Agaricus bisporus var. burnettii]|uniref:Uncharacterized protein n=1 Tax=Agaricus bisporus var. burnettii TaxID=192524 RepID=A0A8H7KGL0_AGABI|nr:hypothetical protein Agabi119p4_5624 [Agaricus bisporus var. burnettii]
MGRIARNAGKPETHTLIASTEPILSNPVTKAIHARRKSSFTKTTARKVGSHISTNDESSPTRKKTDSLRPRPRQTAPENKSSYFEMPKQRILTISPSENSKLSQRQWDRHLS